MRTPPDCDPDHTGAGRTPEPDSSLLTHGVKNSAIAGAVAAAQGNCVIPNAPSARRNVLSCWYSVVDWYWVFALGLTTIHAMRPPPCVLSLPASSNVMISRPSCWNVALASSGAMLFCNQVSAVASEQSCASLHRFGTMLEKCGRVPFARSVANWVKGTRFWRCTESFATSDSSAKTLCLRA